MALITSQNAAIAAGLFLSYIAILIIYRLSFHPLSNFPGPKLTACTLWYEFYYDVILQGQWVFKIKQMHEQYGPIVRINPHELHIKDPDFYQELYAPSGGGKKRYKYQWWCNLAAAPGSIFATVDHEQHRVRRGALNNFFSKKAVGELEGLIRSKVQKLSERFEKAVERRAVVRADCAFMALTMDVIYIYCFGIDKGYLDQDNFGEEWKRILNGAWEKGNLLRHFPYMASVMANFPRSLANLVDKDMGGFLEWQDSVRDIVRPILEYRDSGDEKNQRTIFHELRESDLPKEELELQRLSDEGVIFVGAGSETTAKTLTIILYYLANHPDCLERLRQELKTTMPDANQLPSLSRLEQLPYLSAVIQEGLRTSQGITTRLPRVAAESLIYKDWVIPPSTPVSETPFFVLEDPAVFPEPEAFKPERWLDEGNRLDRYQVAFSKGSRACIGINLAYAELYLTCAAIYRRFNFELYDTSFENIRMAHDFFVAFPKKPDKGVKVKISVDV